VTKEEYEKKISALEPLDEKKRKSVTCALLGHSHITTGCFGYVHCARCGEQKSAGCSFSLRDALVS
jgi:hypothetical protein